jgi:hypothetical protein
MVRRRRKIAVMDTTFETRHVPLPKGGTLELEITPGFYDRVRLHFNLANDVPVDDDHLRMFVFGALKNAVDKAEGEMNDERRP